MAEAVLAGKPVAAEERSSVEYLTQVLEALAVWDAHGLPPQQGGYLDQPMVFMRDIEAVRAILEKKRIQSYQAYTASLQAQSQSAIPDVPPPPIPKRILDEL